MEGRRLSDQLNALQVSRELAEHEVRLTLVEKIVNKQTVVLDKLNSKLSWVGGIIAALMFLMTPQGAALWSLLIK